MEKMRLCTQKCVDSLEAKIMRRRTHPDINCSSRNLPCDSLETDAGPTRADPGGVGTCWGGAVPIEGMVCVPEIGDVTAPRRDSKAFCLSLVEFVGAEWMEETEPAFMDAGVAGPEWGASGEPEYGWVTGAEDWEFAGGGAGADRLWKRDSIVLGADGPDSRRDGGLGICCSGSWN